jgi:hypothetical protein
MAPSEIRNQNLWLPAPELGPWGAGFKRNALLISDL